MYKKEQLLRDTGLFVLGLEGTLCREGRLLDGALDFLDAVGRTKREYIVYTNDDSEASEEYAGKLETMGIRVPPGRLMTAGDVMIRYLKRERPDKAIYLVGTDPLKDCFRKAGIHVVEEEPEIVVVGRDTGFDYGKLEKACAFIRKGAEFLASGPETGCMAVSSTPEAAGREGIHSLSPGCGALCAAITSVTGTAARHLGLPDQEAVRAILERARVERDYAAFVGDRLDVDVAAGIRNGIMSFLVLTGRTVLEDVFSAEKKPDLIFESLREIGEILNQWTR